MRLRIISGELGGRFISAPDSKLTRPTTDRTRETIFNLLSNKISFDEISALDLYGGSGALGLETFSRGAKSVTIVENNFSVAKNLQKNIDDLHASEFVKIYKSSALQFVSKCEEKFDLILADPPFFKYDVYDVVKIILERKLIRHDGLMMIERSIQTKEKDCLNFNIEPMKRIGDTLLYEFKSE